MTSKSELRRIARANRDEITLPNAAHLLCEKFLHNVEIPKNSIIASYFPINSEIDVSFLNCVLLDAGHKICLPCIVGDGEMVFREWLPSYEMLESKYKIPEPSNKYPELQPDIIIIPMLGFDDSLHRLGYGGGYYDRILQNFTGKKIGVAYLAQRLAPIPHEKNDIALDKIITESEVYS